jgi:5S rRNA maturation endonuclease (ribonuclease M5)
MNFIQNTLIDLLPLQRKFTPSGWISFNAVCCHNRGQNRDQRNRGGVLINGEGSWQYHCFNCNFKAGWTPGKTLSLNTRKLFGFLGLNTKEIQKLQLVTLQYKDNDSVVTKIHNLELKEKNLPEGSKSLREWTKQELLDDQKQQLEKVFEYLKIRGMSIDWYNWHWSPCSRYKDRLLIPFYHNGKIVGYTGRKIQDGTPKYLTESQQGYVFNLDAQTTDKKFCLVVEGQFDAIAIDGVAVMTNNINQTQITRLKNLNKEIIIVPDRDRAGNQFFETALNEHWSVSVPFWEKHVKDVADAVKSYGRAYTLYSILYYKETSPLKIELIKKRLQNELF